MNNIQVRIADWQKDNADLRRIREAVFIAEQAVPPTWTCCARATEVRHARQRQG